MEYFLSRYGASMQILSFFQGMGGQHNYWGLWLDSEYGIGECSESCTTYKGYFQMSATKKFTVRNVEVWGVGDKPVKEDEPVRMLDKGEFETVI